MKKLLLALALVCTPIYVTGCRTTATTAATPALAPGYVNQADQQMKAALDAATAFYNRIKANNDSKKTPLSQKEKDAYNQLGSAINAAWPLYDVFHTTGTAAAQQAAQNAVTTVSAQQSTVQALGVN